MNYVRRLAVSGLIVAVGGLGACASMPENIIATPQLQLRDVQVMGLGLSKQDFLLSFEISNPNPFPLPVKHVKYGVRLDGQRFASGETASDLSVPANSSKEFAISVELNLLSTAPRLLSTVRDGVRSEIRYELEGELGIDIPFTPPVKYSNEGTIRLNTGGF